MSEGVWGIIGVVATILANVTAITITVPLVVFKTSGVKLPRWVRGLYHYSLPVYVVSMPIMYVADGPDWHDGLWTGIGFLFWWYARKDDDWDDDDRRRAGLLVRGWVERVGNRLRVVAPVPAT